jgi:hypothetical protein
MEGAIKGIIDYYILYIYIYIYMLSRPRLQRQTAVGDAAARSPTGLNRADVAFAKQRAAVTLQSAERARVAKLLAAERRAEQQAVPPSESPSDVEGAGGLRRRSKARRSKARRSKARRSKARRSKSRRSKARRSKARRSKARRSKARRSKARRSKARRMGRAITHKRRRRV